MVILQRSTNESELPTGTFLKGSRRTFPGNVPLTNYELSNLTFPEGYPGTPWEHLVMTRFSKGSQGTLPGTF